MHKINIANKDYLNPTQLQEQFGISILTQNQMRMRKNQGKQGSLPFIKVGKVILYKRSEIEVWLDERMVNKCKIKQDISMQGGK